MTVRVKKVMAYEVNGHLIPQKDVAEREVRKLVLQEIFDEEKTRDQSEMPEVLAHKWNDIIRRVNEAFAGT